MNSAEEKVDLEELLRRLATYETALQASKEQTAQSAAAQSEQSDRLFRAYLRLQDQIHEAVGAIQRGREASAAAAEELAREQAERLADIQAEVTAARENSARAIQSSNQLLLIAAASFAAFGLLALILTAWFQFRAMNRMAEVTLQHTHALPPPSSYHLPQAGENPHGHAPAPPLPDPLGKAIASLEHRIQDLEQAPLSPATAVGDNSGNGHAPSNTQDDTPPVPEPPVTPPPGPEPPPAHHPSSATLLVAKGQTLINLNKPAEALACLNEVLEADPHHADAWIKKGTALERLKRMDEAIECYDHAIQSDNSLTLAYLYKGAVYNQLERFDDALRCYEQALQAQEKAVPA